ncbi:MAG: DNA mismatch repair protein MutS [Alphaproteobacteria bacterium]
MTDSARHTDTPTGANPSPAGAPKTAPAGKATPMMAQFLDIKATHPDCLLFYRMGDFYELFFDDAVAAAAALDITLTKRGKHDGADVPMCGVPVRAADAYLTRLIRKGFKVAVCEQTEAPAEARKRGGAKSLVAREVARIVTPGTLTEDTLLDARRHNYLVALAEAQGDFALAWLDMSTGAFHSQAVTMEAIASALARLDPGEILLPEPLLQRQGLYDTFADWKAALSPLPASRFDSVNGAKRLEALYRVKALDAFGDFSRAEIAACGALVDYVDQTQKGRLPHLAPPRHLAAGAHMEIDAATRRNLELERALSGGRAGSLLAAIDRTRTGFGARLLARRLAAPLTDPAEIDARLDLVQYFVENAPARAAARDALGRCPDLERALSRLTVGRGGPRDLAAIRDGSIGADALRETLVSPAGLGAPPARLAGALADMACRDALVERLERALKPDPPVLARDGDFIASGYVPQLDELRALRDESKRLIANLQARYAKETGIASLKIRHNNVLGYFIDVTAAHADKLMADVGETFIHRQTMVGGARFTTGEISDLADRILTAADKALALEIALFNDLTGEVAARAEPIGRVAAALAEIDVGAGLAEIAVDRRYCRPKVDDSRAFAIAGGRHPVVEAALAKAGADGFVPNDCDLAEDRRIWLITGPNMAGKSTFLRQNALFAVLAQMGAYLPADQAHIGVVDRLFSRVGAADDLARGRSTFMVEMVETAVILNQAGPRALVILDEIGRGTATFDGLSIAWAAVEHLHEINGARVLFATHYHELTALAARLDALRPHAMRVKEWEDGIVFLHEVAPGAADRSYGIHVARLAGLPKAAVARAEEVLADLERGEQAGALTRLADDLPLFRAAPDAAAPVAPAEPAPVAAALAEVNPDDLTPKAALELLYRLKALL